MNSLEEQWQHFMSDATEEELQVMKLALDAMIAKREQGHDYISNFMSLNSYFEEDQYIMEMPITPFVQNRLGITHGGMTATLIDTAMGRLLHARIIPEGKFAVTSELKINYISPGIGKQLKAIAKIIHKGNHLAVLECKVYNDRDKLVAMASGTFFMLEAGAKV